MVSSNLVALSFTALSGIATFTILRKRSSTLKFKIEFRRVKADCEAEIKDGKDFLSELPDDTLVTILELLPTRDSARTSILSKRWRNLYAFVPRVKLLHLGRFSSKLLNHFSSHKSNDLMKKFMGCARGLQEKFIDVVHTFWTSYEDAVLTVFYLYGSILLLSGSILLLYGSILLVDAWFQVANVGRALTETIFQTGNLVKKMSSAGGLEIALIELW